MESVEFDSGCFMVANWRLRSSKRQLHLFYTGRGVKIVQDTKNFLGIQRGKAKCLDNNLQYVLCLMFVFYNPSSEVKSVTCNCFMPGVVKYGRAQETVLSVNVIE